MTPDVVDEHPRDTGVVRVVRALRERDWSLTTRFSAVAGGLTLLLGLAVLVGVDTTLRAGALDAEADAIARSVAVRLASRLRESDLADPLPPERLAAVDALVVDAAVDEPGRLGTVLWRPDGTVAYASDPRDRRRRSGEDHELGAALDGELVREVIDVREADIGAVPSGVTRLVEVYVPLRLGDGRVHGAFEIYEDAAAVEHRVALGERRIVAVLVVGLALLLGLLLLVVRGASRQLARQSDQLVTAGARAEADRLQTEFVAVVSHELRTPLTAMLGFSELLLDDEVGEADRRRWTASLHAGAERLRHLVEELLDVTRIHEGHMDVTLAPVDVHEVVSTAVEAFHPTAEGLHLTVEVRPAQVPDVLADRDRLLQVLLNVVSNAVKYSPHGGWVRVRARVDGDHVAIVVRDSGIGIPPEELQGLFARFHRIADEDRRGIEGNGLGLHIAERLVTLQHGSLEVTSEGRHRGTTVTVRLPVVRPAAPAPRVPDETAALEAVAP